MVFVVVLFVVVVSKVDDSKKTRVVKVEVVSENVRLVLVVSVRVSIGLVVVVVRINSVALTVMITVVEDMIVGDSVVL